MRSELGAMLWNCRPAIHRIESHRAPVPMRPSFEIIGASVVVGFDEHRYCCDAGPHLHTGAVTTDRSGTTALSARDRRTPTVAPAPVVLPCL